ncbi:MAG: exocyst complex exo70 [Lasallia pustulata]|uniref:Exocyst complex protein EXO70 n=1 Tax=Lasallia pustulata TaxID=136370 RepID=A0A5M8PDH2_9LECA|nr:MAG: exocyst complex exo70 [Lasallia pustulata]
MLFRIRNPSASSTESLSSLAPPENPFEDSAEYDYALPDVYSSQSESVDSSDENYFSDLDSSDQNDSSGLNSIDENDSSDLDSSDEHDHRVLSPDVTFGIHLEIDLLELTKRQIVDLVAPYAERLAALIESLVEFRLMASQRNVAHAEESAEVAVFYATLEKLKSLTKKIQGSLTRLEANGRVVSEAVGPVHDNTQSSQTLIQNLERISSAIDQLQKPLEGKAREEKIIYAGPNEVGVQEYMASLKRIDQALANMNATNLRVNQQTVGDLKNLLSHGTRQLHAVFRSILNEDLQPVEPLHYITKHLPFPTLPEDKTAILRSIELCLSWSASHGESTDRESLTIQTYSAMRGLYIANSLHNLATASIITARKKSPDENYRQNTNGIGTYATGLEKMLLAEYQSIVAVFSQANWAAVFKLTYIHPLADFEKTLRDLNSHINSNITTDCFLAYELIDIVTPISVRLEDWAGARKPALADALKQIRGTAKFSLGELLEEVRKRIQNMQVLPGDGAAIPLTTAIMTRLQTMILYPLPLYSIMTEMGDGNWLSASTASSSSASMTSAHSVDLVADGRQLLAHYVNDTIDTLLQSLDSRARVLLKSKSIPGVFLANNIAVINRMIHSSDLASVLSVSPSPPKWDIWRKKGNSAYLDSWKEACSALLDVQYTSRGARPPSGSQGMIDSAAVIKSLGSKEKDAIKEKFKTFNTIFDELSAKHMGLAMEREVRSQLSREVAAMIEPLYGRFWDRYHEIDKGKGKYVKYDKGGLSGQLAQLALI